MTQNLYISIAVPTKPYLRKFLEFNLPSNRKIATDHLLCKTILSALQKPKEQLYYGLDRYAFNYHDQIVAKLPESLLARYGADLREEHVNYLNQVWEMVFNEVLYTTLDVMHELHPRESLRLTIDTLLDRYNIHESEMSYQTLKKRYYRYRKKRKNLCSDCP